MARHLTYSYEGAYNANKSGHAQDVMKELGITYQHSTPQSMGSAFWFWNCENIPENLPKYIYDLDIDDPLEYVGWGLSEKMAIAIKNYKTT